MKRILSLLLCLSLVLGFALVGNAATQSKTYTFASYEKGTQYAENEVHKLDDMTTVTTTQSHFTTELRLYSSAEHNGFAVIQFAKPITKIALNVGNKKDTLNVYGSTDGAAWTLVSGIAITDTAYKDYELAMPTGTNYTYLKLDVAGSNQLRVKSFTLYYEIEGACAHANTKYTYTDAAHQKVCADCGEKMGAEEAHAYTDNKCVCGRVNAPAANSTLTIAEAIALGKLFEKDQYTSDKYYVTGVITEVYQTTYGNMYIKDAVGNTLTVYGTYSADGSTRYDKLETKPVAGDTVTVYGVIGKYNDPQMKDAWITAHTPGKTEPDKPVEKPATLAEQIAEAKKLANKAYLSYESTITGTITDDPTVSKYDTTQFKFTVTDGTNTLLCYFVPVTGGTPKKGDTVTVTGKLTAFNGDAQFDSTAKATLDKSGTTPNPDEEAAAAVDTLIEKIGTVTLDSKAAIEAARTAYNALTDAQKALVKKLDVLTAAEKTLADLEKPTEPTPNPDEEAAAAVDTLIEKIGTVTLESEAAIKAARTAYDALTDAQKALVKNLKTLTDAEAALKKLRDDAAQAAADQAAAAAVDALIDAIGAVTKDSEAAIKAARDAYDKLTDTQKALVKKLQALTDAEAALKKLQDDAAQAAADKAAADAVVALIEAIGEVKPESGDAIKAARDAYDKLTDAQKAMVTNYDTLTRAEDAYEGSSSTGDNTVVFFALMALSMAAAVVLVSKKRAF